jgi:hypothetical protein
MATLDYDSGREQQVVILPFAGDDIDGFVNITIEMNLGIRA